MLDAPNSILHELTKKSKKDIEKQMRIEKLKKKTGYNKAYAIMLPFMTNKNVIVEELDFVEQILILKTRKRVARRIPRPLGAINRGAMIKIENIKECMQTNSKNCA